MHGLACRTKFNIILPDNPCRKVELAESQHSMENSSGALLLSSFDPIISAIKGFIVFGRRKIPWTLRANAKVTNILKELANPINMK